MRNDRQNVGEHDQEAGNVYLTHPFSVFRPPSVVCRPPSVVRRLASGRPSSPDCRPSSGFRQSSLFSGLSSVVWRPSSGFTLIELLVVMVIAAIIMAVSLPSFISIGRGAGMRTAVNNVRATVALSRQWAITHREQITFVAQTNLVYPDDEGIPVTNPAYTAFNQSGVRVQKGVPLPLDVTFGNPDPINCVTNLIFKTDGGLDGVGSATVRIVLVDARMPGDPAKQKTIAINGLTGGIRVE